MKVNVIGTREVDFEKDGKRIQGKSVFYTYKNMNVNGRAADKLFLNIASPMYSKVAPNQELNVEFNQYGKVQDVELLK